jgi:hypothetical protein
MLAGAAMLYAKAFAVGVVTGVLAPVVVAVASFVLFWVPLFLGGSAVAGAYPVNLHVHDQSFFLSGSPGHLLMQMTVGSHRLF